MFYWIYIPQMQTLAKLLPPPHWGWGSRYRFAMRLPHKRRYSAKMSAAALMAKRSPSSPFSTIILRNSTI
jgi:hypothetical protein